MQITVQYEAQLRRAAGTGEEAVDLPDASDAVACVQQVAETHGDPLKSMLVTDDGGIQPTLLLFRNDSQVVRGSIQPLTDGDTLTLMTPISGG